MHLKLFVVLVIILLFVAATHAARCYLMINPMITPFNSSGGYEGQKCCSPASYNTMNQIGSFGVVYSISNVVIKFRATLWKSYYQH